MAKKRKISIRKVLQALVTLIVTTACVTAILGASRMQRSRRIADVRIHINSPRQYQFLDKRVLYKELVTDLNIQPGKTTLATLDVSAIERKAYKNPWVGKTQAWVDNQNMLHMQLTPRRPAARIFYENGQSFYVDSTLRLLPLSDMNTYYTIIVTGMPVTDNDSINKSLRAQTLKIVRFIERDTFWSAQIDQVAITKEGAFELMPVLGTHRILIGDTASLDKKFANLFSFYRHVLNRIGWNKYETLDLRYNDQVVASPSLPWKMPSGNGALSNMDWVNSIMEEGRKDSASTAAPAPPKVNVAPPTVAAQAKAAPAPKLQPKQPAPLPVKKQVSAKNDVRNTSGTSENSKSTPKYLYHSPANH